MVSRLKIVLVEDHLNLREILANYLSQEGHHIIQAADAQDLDEALAREEVGIVVLDLNLPGEDGLSIASRLKSSRPNLFIVMLTARQRSEDRVKGYESGADVYITKPSSALELSAAIKSFERRRQAAIDSEPSLRLNVHRRELIGQISVGLNAVELLLLKALSLAPEQRLEYFRLLELLEIGVDARGKAGLEVHITRLRKKMVDVGAKAPAIRAIRNKGYQLVERVTLT